MRVAITTVPFACPNKLPLDAFLDSGAEIDLCTRWRGDPLPYSDVLEMLEVFDPHAIVAGTERYDRKALETAKSLELIARVGIGLDSVDLSACRDNGVAVTFTPDAPSNAVAELVVGQMINMLRGIEKVSGRWERRVGRELRECNVGIIGMGRIGSLVLEKLQGLKPRRVLVNDTISERMTGRPRAEPAGKAEIYSTCDIVTIHVPKEPSTLGMVGAREFAMMRPTACLINMSRGGIVDEAALEGWLGKNPGAAAAVDTFEHEPYEHEGDRGPLLSLSNFYPTPHLGSCTDKSRLAMEMGAVSEVLRFIRGEKHEQQVC